VRQTLQRPPRDGLLSRLRPSAEPVVLVVTVRAHGCPVPAIVAACGFDERTVADWWARAGRQGQAVQECLGERPRDLGQVQADESRVKHPGGLGGRALALRGTTRWWLGGAGREPRDLPLLRRLSERGKRGAAHRPRLLCTEGWVSYMRAMRETFRDPVHTGQGGRPRRRPWRHGLMTQVVKRYERRRVVAPDRRLVDGTPARVEPLRRRSHGAGGSHPAYSERLTATVRERLALLARRCRALARHTLPLHAGMFLVGTVSNLCTPPASWSSAPQTTPAMAAGSTDHGWTRQELLAFPVPLPRWGPPKQRGRPSRAFQRLIKRWCS
jgi:hypothetical protein